MAATPTVPQHVRHTTEVWRFVVRWCYFVSGLAPVYFVAWYLMHVLVVLVEKARLFSSQRVLYFVIGTRVRSQTLPSPPPVSPLFRARSIRACGTDASGTDVRSVNI